MPEATDTVFVYEGILRPIAYARLVLSPARPVLMLLAPPGLFGWSFLGPWSVPDPSTVPLDSVGRPEQLLAAAAAGFSLWTHMPALAAVADAAGVPCSFIGNGSPLPLPEPPVKRYDVATFVANRWADGAERAVRGLEPDIEHRAIEPGSHANVLARLGAARILVHPSRIEGHSRIGLEARSLATVPVVLSSKRFGVGLEEEAGAVAVDSVEAIPRAVRDLLASPARLAELAERGRASARRQTDWPTYLERVEAALRRLPEAKPEGAAFSEFAAGLEAGGEARASRRHRRELDAVEARLRAAEDALERERALLAVIAGSRSWRLTKPLRAARQAQRDLVRRARL